MQFNDHITSQALWGNRFLLHNVNKIILHCILESGLFYICDQKLVNGVLDQNYVYMKLKKKTNVYSDLIKVKGMLRVYRDEIGNNEPVEREYDTQLMFNGKYNTFDDIVKSKLSS